MYLGFGLQRRPALVTYGVLERVFVECSVNGFCLVSCELHYSLTLFEVGCLCLDSAEGVWTKGKCHLSVLELLWWTRSVALRLEGYVFVWFVFFSF